MAAPTQYKDVPTSELYNQWAGTYDTDGNVLQATDDYQLATRLPSFIQSLPHPQNGSPLKILDLGCGTGRNTLALLSLSRPPSQPAPEICGWDSSAAMLALAREKCPRARFDEVDLSNPASIPASALGTFDAVISTLVLEHLPASTFFTTLASVLKPGGEALVTNMHPDMGARTGAGFKLESGERCKGVSFSHTVAEAVEAAEAAGLEVVGEVEEKAVDDEMVESWTGKGKVESRAGKWLRINIWFGMVVKKKEEMCEVR